MRMKNPLLLCVCAVILVSGSVQARPLPALHVEKWGSDSNPCSESAPCLTIGKAISLADAHREIRVGPGIYTENLTIRDDSFQSRVGLVLKSKAGRYATMIKAEHPKFPIVSIESAGVRFGGIGAGFTVLGQREGEYFTREEIATSIQEGIVIQNPAANAIRIEGNRAMGMQVGFRFFTGRGLQVRDNIAKNNMAGFSCWQCDQALFTENQALENRNVGMLIGWHDGLGWRNEDQGMPDGLQPSNKVSILRNKISTSHYYGLFVTEYAEGYRITDNVIDRTTTDEGVTIHAAGESLFQGNIIAGDAPHSVDDALDIFNQEEAEGYLHVVDNLAVSMASAISSDLRGQSQVVIEKNRAVGSKWSGMRFTESPGVPEVIRSNDTYGSVSSCGMDNQRIGGATIEYEDHFYGAGDAECGAFSHSGGFRTMPRPLNVNTAKAL